MHSLLLVLLLAQPTQAPARFPTAANLARPQSAAQGEDPGMQATPLATPTTQRK
jgi:hypothetical protein